MEIYETPKIINIDTEEPYRDKGLRLEQQSTLLSYMCEVGVISILILQMRKLGCIEAEHFGMGKGEPHLMVLRIYFQQVAWRDLEYLEDHDVRGTEHRPNKCL